ARGAGVKRIAAAASPSRAAGAPDPFAHPSTIDLVRRALAEDIGRGDITTAATVAAGTSGRALPAPPEGGARAGAPLGGMVLAQLHAPGALRVTAHAREGQAVQAGAVLAEIEGELAPLLTGERVLLNLVQGLCGVATLTRRYVDAVAGTRVAILDTRKTT